MKKQQLREYCEAEFENIDAVVAELFVVVQAGKSMYSTAEMAAAATFIHNFYNGIENILKRVLLFKKIETRNSSTWHKDLLQTAFDSGILTTGLHDSLSNYLSFRHFFVHAYSFTLRWEELKPLVNDLEDTLEQFKSEVHDFISLAEEG